MQTNATHQGNTRYYLHILNFEVDIWSVGCIMAELLTGRPLFPGDDRMNKFDLETFKNIFSSEIDQITKVLNICGTPTNETLNKITSEEVCIISMKVINASFFPQAMLYIRSLPNMEKKDFQGVFPGANPQGIRNSCKKRLLLFS